MSAIKHPDTYACDICGAELAERRPVNVPAVWTTEQTEGRFCEPHCGVERLDLCEERADRVHVVEAAGAQGRNSYVFRKAVGERSSMLRASRSCSLCPRWPSRRTSLQPAQSAERAASCFERSASGRRGWRMTPETRQKAMRAIGFLEGFSAWIWAHVGEDENLAPEFAGAYDDYAETLRKAITEETEERR